MDTTWWLALLGVVVLAMIATIVDGRGRSPRHPGGRTRPPTRADRVPSREPGRAPGAGEIWWARVPYEDGPGSKDRPCLVLSVQGRTVLVAKITSTFHEERPGVIALPPDAVGDRAGRRSFLETDELREVELREFRRRVGAANPALWERVRHLAR